MKYNRIIAVKYTDKVFYVLQCGLKLQGMTKPLYFVSFIGNM